MNNNLLTQLIQGVQQRGLGGEVNNIAQQIPQVAQQVKNGSISAMPWQNTVQVGQPLTQQNIHNLPPNMQSLAQVYNQNPQDPRVAHIDPALFGYAPDGPMTTHFPLAGKDSIGSYRDGGINSIGGHIGQYGGTIGTDNGQPFANMNRNGQATDPLTELRRLLGL